MNRTLSIFVFLLLQIGSMAQTHSFNYQAVVRDSNGKVMANNIVDFSIDIILNGQTKYSEQHNGIDTGSNGIVTFKIGEGTSPSSDFSALDWGDSSYKIRISMNGELLGISNITAVPIALYALHSADNPWTLNSSDQSLSYTEGMTEVQDLKITGSSNLAAEAGIIRFDTANNDFIGYDGAEWKSLTTTSSDTTHHPWVYHATDKSLTYTEGITKVQDLKISGSSNFEAEAGIIRYDTLKNDFVGYNGTEWKSLTVTAETANSPSTPEYISNETELKAALADLNPNIIIDQDLTLSKPITLEYAANLESLGSQKKITTSGTDAIIIKASDVNIQNIAFNSDGGGIAITLQAGISNIQLSNLAISNYNRAIYKSGSSTDQALSSLRIVNIKVQNSQISGSEATVSLQGNIEDLDINRLTINNSAGQGLKITDVCSGSINGLQVNDSKADAIIFSNTTTTSSPRQSISLTDVKVQTSSGVGITIEKSAVSVANVKISNATGSAVKISGSTSDLQTPAQISNLTVSATQVSGTNSYGVSLLNNAMANISNFYIVGNSTTTTDANAVGVYSYDSQDFVVNGGVFMKLGKLIAVENSN